MIERVRNLLAALLFTGTECAGDFASFLALFVFSIVGYYLCRLSFHLCVGSAPFSAQDLRGIHEANDAFHVALFSACGNPYLVRSLQDYMNLTLPMRAKNLADKEGLALSRRQHEFMIELLGGRDSWALAQLCVDHMQFSKSDYLGRIGADQPAK